MTYYTRNQIAKKLSVSMSTIERWIYKPGGLTGMWFPKPDLAIGNTIRYSHETINKWLVDISKRPLWWKGATYCGYNAYLNIIPFKR